MACHVAPRGIEGVPHLSMPTALTAAVDAEPPRRKLHARRNPDLEAGPLGRMLPR